MNIEDLFEKHSTAYYDANEQKTEVLTKRRFESAVAEMELQIFDLEQQLEERNVSIQALEKVNELVKCLQDAAIVCKEKNELKSGDASYWLGAENAYLQVVKSVKREFNID